MCTANQCRSPLAAGLLEMALRGRGCLLAVSSAGVSAVPAPVPDEVLRVSRDVGLDLSAHLARRVDRELLDSAGLVVTMTRNQLVDVIVTAPEVWDHAFTYVELLRRGRVVGPRRGDLTLEAWVAHVHGGRARRDLLLRDRSDDIDDPMGQRLRAFQRTRDELAGLGDELAGLLCPAETSDPAAQTSG